MKDRPPSPARRLASAALFALAGLPAAAADFTTVTLNYDGAWCWFQDERALIAGDSVAFASITRAGNVQVTSWDWNTGKREQATLRENFDADDHNVPGMTALPDGRLQAFYCQHGRETAMHARTAKNAGSVAEWLPEETFDFGLKGTGNFTYANPFRLSEENGRTYLFWRGVDFNPTVSWSDDDGRTWAKGRNALYFKKGQRPYVKYAGNGRDAVHFAFTEAHPRNFDNSIYHAFYRDGHLRDSSGTAVRRMEDGPLTVAEAVRVYSADQAGKAWIWDIALDAAGSPALVYATVPTIADHRYRYACWNPETCRWTEREIAFAGRGLYEKEREYSGGICLDPDDVSIVYLSANVNPVTGKRTGTGRYEIYRGQTPDAGLTWNWSPLTANSSQDNLRPVVPQNHPGEIFALWMCGNYTTYRDYDTDIVLGTDAPLPEPR